MAHLSRMLANLCRGAIPMDRSLALIAAENAPYPVRRIVPSIILHIRNGGTLTDAFRTQRRVLPDEFIELISAAELGGKMQAALERLATMYEQRLAYLRQLIGDMTYPLCLWLSAAYIIPFFQGLVLTKDPVETYIARFFLGVAISWAPIVITLVVLGQLGLLEKIGRSFSSRVWPVSHVARKYALVQFLRSLGMLLVAGLTTTKAIERAAATTVNPHMRARLVTAVPMVQGGETLTEALAATHMLPDMAVDMVRTGEHSGRLEELLYKCAQYVEDELHHSRYLLRNFTFALVIPAVMVSYAFFALLPLLLRHVYALVEMWDAAG